MSLRELLWNVLAFGAFPAWLAAGAADWLCHRRSRLEATSGPRESLLHILLFVEIAVPVALGLWLEPTLPLLLFMAFAVLAHMLTTWWDTSLAQPRRHIAPLEQQIHGWLEMLPVFALVSVALLNAGELTDPRWQLQPLEVAPPPMVRAIVLLALAMGLGFTLEEWLRARRFSAASSASAGAPRR